MNGEPRLIARLISRQLLRDAMDLHGIRSASELARRAVLPVGLVGHLVGGRRPTCTPKAAHAIEEILYRTPQPLFVIEVSPMADNPPPKKGTAA
jgi:hypothetical protein